MYTRTLARTAGIALAAGALAAIPIAAAAAPHSVDVGARLTVTGGPPPVCHAGICSITNHGTGQMTPFGKVTFTTVITADGTQPPCGSGSQWVTQIIRTIHTSKGTLVLHEAGLQCPQRGVGPRVDLVWALDGTHSTGIFAGAHGRGYDLAYPFGTPQLPTERSPSRRNQAGGGRRRRRHTLPARPPPRASQARAQGARPSTEEPSPAWIASELNARGLPNTV